MNEIRAQEQAELEEKARLEAEQVKSDDDEDIDNEGLSEDYSDTDKQSDEADSSLDDGNEETDEEYNSEDNDGVFGVNDVVNTDDNVLSED